jgi:capsular polysaccharide biosynthesis protein
VNLTTYLTAGKRYWKTFVIVAGLVLAAGLSWLILTPAKYVSTEQLMVSIEGSTTAAAYENDQVVTSRVNSYIPLLTSDVVSQRVIDELGLPLTAPELAAKVSAARVPPNTALIDVAVTDESPAQAKEIAATLAAEFISYTEALETPTGEDDQKVHTTIVTSAREPQQQTTERVLLGVVVAATALLAGAVAVWVRARTDPVVRTADGAAATAGLRVLGSVVTAPQIGSAELQDYRRVRTRLRTMTDHTETVSYLGRCLVLASTNGEADAAAVARNLGRVLELTGDRTVVVNGEMADRIEGEHGSHGPSNGYHPWPIPERGAEGDPDTLSPSNGADLYGTKTGFRLIDRLKVEYRTVLIAAPGVLSAITAFEASEHADQLLLLAALGATRRRDLRRAADELRSAGAPLTGLVLVGKSADVEPAEPAHVDTARSQGIADETSESDGAPSKAVVSSDDVKGI